MAGNKAFQDFKHSHGHGDNPTHQRAVQPLVSHLHVRAAECLAPQALLVRPLAATHVRVRPANLKGVARNMRKPMASIHSFIQALTYSANVPLLQTRERRGRITLCVCKNSPQKHLFHRVDVDR